MANTVAAVVVAFNRKELLAECLRGLLKQICPVDAIYVIDNASSDGTEAYLDEAGLLAEPKIHYEALPVNLGGAGGFASGMERAYSAGYTWVWLMDDDAEPFPDALEKFQPFMQEPATAALANLKLDTDGGVLIYHVGTVQWRSSAALVRLLPDESLTSPGKVPIGFSSFIGLLVHRGAIAKIGFPRREFFIHGDDNEYSVRLLRAGNLYLVPSSKIVHKEKIVPPTTEKHWGSSKYRCVPIEKYAFEFFGIRNRMWTLLQLSPETRAFRYLRVARDVAAMVVKIVLYERNYRLLRLRLLAHGVLDAIRGRFDNSIPFEIRKRFATKQGKI
jgi:rhamnopyranosyl-N-acetylglucosaminyl-diphospho-decaprenol beta-1,3/1,4-galactofuranosyltransferase